MSVSGVSTSLPTDMFASLSPSAYAKKTKAQDTPGTPSSGSGSLSSTASGSTSIGSTFLNLLVQELQNQDPTAPVDSTAMVGQMISLNQLDQLININQNLTPPASSSTATPSGTGSSTSGSATGKVVSGFADAASSLLQPSNSMSAAAANASDPSQPLNLSSLSHIYGGK